jgi:hypothetical protein
MPIAKLKPDVTAPIPFAPELAAAQKETYLGIVADNNDTPTNSLVAYLDGMPWSVTYYSQLLGKHNDLQELDPGQNAAFQQYQKVIDLQIRVSAALTNSYDSENAITSVSGGATIVQMVPNANDYFIAEAGSRELGLFRIKSVERLSFNRDSAYAVQYDLVCYVRDNEERIADIESKVVRQYVFSMQRLAEGLSPVLREDVHALMTTLSQDYHGLIQQYFKKFFNRTYMTLVVPGQTKLVYDSRMVDFLMQIMESAEVEEMRAMQIISTDHERYLASGSLWSVLLERRYDSLSYVPQKSCLAPKAHFNRSSWLKGPIYTRMDYFVYPVLGESDVLVPGDPTPKQYDFTSMEGPLTIELPERIVGNTYTNGTTTLPFIKSVLIDDFYVLSEVFYANGLTTSVLEILIRDYLKCVTLDMAMLKALVDQYRTWPVLEQFYYGPLLMLLLKTAIQGFYK